MAFEDIQPFINSASEQSGTPEALILGCAIAESNLYPFAERWGTATNDAKAAIRDGEWDTLQGIIDSEWPDISFGYSQCIVLFHYEGNHEATVDNCISVRNRVFADPARDILEIGKRLRNHMDLASYLYSEGLLPHQVFDDVEPIWLAALIRYNAGRIPVENDPWWDRWAGNVANYKAALVSARELLGGNGLEDLRNLVGYLQGDVAAAIRGPIESTMKKLKKGSANWNRLQSALHAVETLERGG